MTVLVGILCRDGIVAASDSQESDDEEGLKRLDVRKLYDTSAFGFNDVEIIVGGTGMSAHMMRLVEVFKEEGYAPIWTQPREVADVAEKSIGRMKARYEADLDLEILLGVWCKTPPVDEDAPPRLALYNVLSPDAPGSVGVAEAVPDYTALGSGGPFARYLFQRFHDEGHPPTKLPMSSAILEAVYAVEEVKKISLHCGGDTQLVCITNDGKLKRHTRDEIAAIVSQLDAMDRNIKRRQRGAMAAVAANVTRQRGRR